MNGNLPPGYREPAVTTDPTVRCPDCRGTGPVSECDCGCGRLACSDCMTPINGAPMRWACADRTADTSDDLAQAWGDFCAAMEQAQRTLMAKLQDQIDGSDYDAMLAASAAQERAKWQKQAYERHASMLRAAAEKGKNG